MENRVYKAFDQIRADEKVVAHTKQFIAAKSMEKQQGFRSVRKVLAACATLFILMGTSGLVSMSIRPLNLNLIVLIRLLVLMPTMIMAEKYWIWFQ